jgi:hypothetical protein
VLSTEEEAIIVAFRRHTLLPLDDCLTSGPNFRQAQGEFAFWVTEPGLPRLVRALSGDKVTLFEPGADDGSGRKIAAAYLDAIDLECDYRKH